ncbi:uncharacterized protein LOC127710758 isoform X3 [Mytilus californianus]|uniref:uncharacterized protein LOC127710758 isoform X1 n=1 Tax=Mytilus californianus TaxID=6549 RepID=UPI0022458D59|nr:uncharacterized protein LOC127710758 isoform X1 [Mytilus californianus]XP_052072682.1 uncharacterized protein LOC127710758 isoform X2 [Mytilus californianus]XP_052072683.1 uncharacterized protein LOC127710758 isoform X3 [Mytilus californianus]
MQQFVVICLLVMLPIFIAQGRRPKNGAKQDTRADIRKCRDCRRFFKGDNFQLCLKLFCSTDKTRKNLKNRKRCNSCTRFRAQKKQQTCREVFCTVPTSLDPNTFTRIATALTVDMLCQYCRIRRNRNCLRKFGCQG